MRTDIATTASQETEDDSTSRHYQMQMRKDWIASMEVPYIGIKFHIYLYEKQQWQHLNNKYAHDTIEVWEIKITK